MTFLGRPRFRLNDKFTVVGVLTLEGGAVALVDFTTATTTGVLGLDAREWEMAAWAAALVVTTWMAVEPAPRTNLSCRF